MDVTVRLRVPDTAPYSHMNEQRETIQALRSPHPTPSQLMAPLRESSLPPPPYANEEAVACVARGFFRDSSVGLDHKPFRCFHVLFKTKITPDASVTGLARSPNSTIAPPAIISPTKSSP